MLERKIEYMMPANSLVKAAKAYESWRWVTRSPALSVVEVDTSTPDVPYGNTFTTKVSRVVVLYSRWYCWRTFCVVTGSSDGSLPWSALSVDSQHS